MSAADPLFDAYLVVDWSAASKPTRPEGHDTIWFCHRRRLPQGGVAETIENCTTRHGARRRLGDLLAADRAAGRATLAGFDFPLGYPAGFAARLGGPGTGWRAVWQALSALIEDAPDNGNNRFAVAAALNRKLTQGAAPFWGCPRGRIDPFLAPTHHRRHAETGFAERRLTDLRARRAQPIWKLHYTGSVGSQALTGIPVVKSLREDPALAGAALVWPFETGLAPLARRPGAIVLAEVYPSLIPLERAPGEVKDRAQVRCLAAVFAALDEAGALGGRFAGDPGLSAAERRLVETEEGWILGTPILPAPVAAASA